MRGVFTDDATTHYGAFTGGPDEMAGMAGRIIVGTPPASGFWDAPAPDVPPPVLATLPPVDLILKTGRIERPSQP